MKNDRLFLQIKLDEDKYPKFMKLLTNNSEICIYMKLVGLMRPYWNSIDYTNMNDLCQLLELKSRRHLTTYILHLEKLNLIKRSGKYLYINYNYATKCDEKLLRDEVFEVFGETKPNNNVVPIIKKPRNIVNVGF